MKFQKSSGLVGLKAAAKTVVFLITVSLISTRASHACKAKTMPSGLCLPWLTLIMILQTAILTTLWPCVRSAIIHTMANTEPSRAQIQKTKTKSKFRLIGCGYDQWRITSTKLSKYDTE